MKDKVNMAVGCTVLVLIQALFSSAAFALGFWLGGR